MIGGTSKRAQGGRPPLPQLTEIEYCYVALVRLEFTM